MPKLSHINMHKSLLKDMFEPIAAPTDWNGDKDFDFAGKHHDDPGEAWHNAFKSTAEGVEALSATLDPAFSSIQINNVDPSCLGIEEKVQHLESLVGATPLCTDSGRQRIWEALHVVRFVDAERRRILGHYLAEGDAWAYVIIRLSDRIHTAQRELEEALTIGFNGFEE
jgi:hypothetical protein